MVQSSRRWSAGLYHESHGRKFNEDFPEGIQKFMHAQLGTELAFEPQKGQEVLVDLQRRGEARAFLAANSKKQRKADRQKKEKRKRGDEEAEEAVATEAANSSSASVGGRLGSLGMPAAYADPTERVLILGEADFSWAASLLRLCDTSVRRRRLTATSYDDRSTLHNKYGSGLVDTNVDALKASGATVLHVIDATRLVEYESLTRRAPFDLIVFIFHTRAAPTA